MPRLTAELIESAPVYMNPLGEREINLRGFHIPAMENLGVTGDEYEVIDVSDNAVVKLDNFPLLTHLTTLICANNKIQRLSPTLGTSLPNLTHLVLTNNRLSSIPDLYPLHSLPRLSHLSLRLCPVASVTDYRLRVLWVLPGLKELDFCRVRGRERTESRERFGVFVARKEEVERTEVVGGQGGGGGSVGSKGGEEVNASPGGGGGMLQEQMKRLIASIEAANSLEEITALEQQLAALHQMQRGSGVQT